ncbi:hypothetical protein D910_11446, partial [Dendroctonus ponderosae]
MHSGTKKSEDPSLLPSFMTDDPQTPKKLKTGPSHVTPSMLYPHAATSVNTSGGVRKKDEDTGPKPDEDDEAERRMVEASRRGGAKENILIDGKISIISRISIVNFKSIALTILRDGKREALCCKYNEEFDYIAVGYADGVIIMYQSGTGEPVFTLTDGDVKENRAPVTSIKHRPVSKIYPITNCYTGTYANGCVKCWSYNFNQCLYTIREKRQTFGIVYHPRFPKFVTFGDDLKVYFYDEETKTQERVLSSSDNPETHDGHMSRVFAACFHPKNNYELLTAGWDDVVQFWDLRQPHAARHISGVHMCGEGLDINQKGTEVLACSWQKEDPLQIFDYGSTKRINCLEPDIYNSKLYCGKYATRDFVVCAGSDPNLIRVVDLQTTA